MSFFALIRFYVSPKSSAHNNFRAVYSSARQYVLLEKYSFRPSI